MTSTAISDLAIFEPVLARLEADVVTHFGTSGLRLVARERHERPASHILRVGVCTAAGQALSHLFVKVSKPRVIPNAGPDAMQARVAHDFETTRRTYAALSAHAELGVVTPVACYPDLLAIVTEQAEGSPLLRYLQTRAGWLPREETLSELRDTIGRVGRWVRVFQQLGPTGGLSDVEELRGYINIRLGRLVNYSRGRFLEHDRGEVLRHIDALGARVEREQLRQVTVHSDLSLGNVLVCGGRIVVLDFTMTRLDNWLHDITKVFVRVGLLSLKPKFTVRVVRDLQSALLAGFDPALSPEQPLFRLLVLQHRVNHLAALYERPHSGVQAAYDALVRSHHWSRLRAELATGVDRG